MMHNDPPGVAVKDAMPLARLVSHSDWFRDIEQPDRHGDGPAIIVVDDFYPDPLKIRELALGMDYVSYVPPAAAVVGEAIAAGQAHRQGSWLATALVAYHGRPAERPFYGERHNPPSICDRLEAIVDAPIDRESWDYSGDHWNGAFHLLTGGMKIGSTMIHHHYKSGDLDRPGWSGLVYLSPDAPASAGTSFWRHRASGRCVAGFDAPYEPEEDAFDLVHLCENLFNRLVLFRENVWHRVEHGFGEDRNARLSQTFFFATL